MIGYLEGKLKAKTPNCIIVDVNGVGYDVCVPLSTFYELPDPGQTVSLNVHTYVREDAIQLYGFRTLSEKEMFLMLIAVNGVGPRLAVNILSGISPDGLRQVILNQDRVRLKNIPGVGKKIVERVLLELTDKIKVKSKETPGASSAYADAFSALINLGYRPNEAEKALNSAKQTLDSSASVEQLLKIVLKTLA
jgi:Holliday junction DNA helicase RuvA